MSSAVVLHQFEISPFCQKVAMALKFKGIEYSTVDYNGLQAAKAQKLSKAGKLPVLDIDGMCIQDSTRIARYLDDAYPDRPALYPKDLSQRVLAELWEDWADELLYWYEVYFRVNDAAALDEAVAISVQGRPAHERYIAKPLLKAALKSQLYFQGLGRMAAADVEAEFHRHLDRIEHALEPSGWLVGEHKCIADIAVAAQLSEIVRTSRPMGAVIRARPAIVRWLGL
ncbi:MAG: glutathione S-transferase family protein [Marinobacter sp.]|nr:glutathione S-transferase family protein [Marinobacter sp.]